jgi:hypothetical protein
MDNMDTALAQPTRARLIAPGHQQVSVRSTLRYTAADPYAVHIDFPGSASLDGGSVSWTFARALLEEGLSGPAGIGDVHIWPCGWARTVVELHSPHGLAMIHFETAALRRFLCRSYAVVADGGEDLEPVLDDGLASLLGGV